jgi:hypothetical protein
VKGIPTIESNLISLDVEIITAEKVVPVIVHIKKAYRRRESKMHEFLDLGNRRS